MIDPRTYVGYEVGRLTFAADNGHEEARRSLRHLHLLHDRLKRMPPERAVEPLRGLNVPRPVRRVLAFIERVVGECGSISAE